MDQEFIGFQETGLDLIQELGIEGESYLITSHYSEDLIQTTCEINGVPLIPKEIISYIRVIKL